MIVAKLKSGGGKSPSTKPASRRRRRYTKSKSKRSLVEVESSEGSEDDALQGEDDEDFVESPNISLITLSASEKAQLESRKTHIKQRMAELSKESVRIGGLLQESMNKAVEVAKKAGLVEDKSEGLMEEIKNNDLKESGLSQKLGESEEMSEKAKA